MIIDTRTITVPTLEPGVIAPKPIESPPWPGNHPNIGYDSRLIDNNVSVTATAGEQSKNALLNPATYDRWTPGATSGEWIATFDDGLTDYAAIAAHNFGSTGTQVEIQVTNNGGTDWNSVGSATPDDDKPIVFLFVNQTINGIKLILTGSDQASIGVLYAGEMLIMMRPIYGGHQPVRLNANDVFTPQISDSGQYLGRVLVRRGYKTSADFQHLKSDWYRQNFQPFVDAAKTRPYFWLWNPLEHPDDIVYAWTNNNIQPSNMGIRNLMSVSLDIEAHA